MLVTHALAVILDQQQHVDPQTVNVPDLPNRDLQFFDAVAFLWQKIRLVDEIIDPQGVLQHFVFLVQGVGSRETAAAKQDFTVAGGVARDVRGFAGELCSERHRPGFEASDVCTRFQHDFSVAVTDLSLRQVLDVEHSSYWPNGILHLRVCFLKKINKTWTFFSTLLRSIFCDRAVTKAKNPHERRGTRKRRTTGVVATAVVRAAVRP